MDAMHTANSAKHPLDEETLQQLIERYSRPASEVILDDVDLRNLLKISRRTALEYRKKEIFPFYKIENKIFYILSEVIDGIKKQKSNNEN